MSNQTDDGLNDDIQTELIKSGFKNGVRNELHALALKIDRQIELFEQLIKEVALLSDGINRFFSELRKT